jgi:hypothetical protein
MGVRASAVAGVLLLLSCSMGGSPISQGENQKRHDAPAISELSAKLDAELLRLGKDPTKTIAVAPKGSDNAVFDLSAQLIDAEGDVLTPEDISSGAVVAGVKLEWTEQLVGDYDQNGEVNIGDLTPLAQYWQALVDYDDPALHGGFARWPSGDPEDDGWPTGTSAPPKEGSGANNWRRARVDGDSNGEINIADITPIAAHWQESSDGYRVYRKAPSESGFTALPYTDISSGGGAPPSFDITVLRTDAYPDGSSQPDPARPLLLALADADARADKLGIGVYSYYVAPYDAQSDTEGPKSAAVSIDLATGSVNFAPVAKLAVNPDFGGAPAVITLDASGSYDMDGSIAELQWDLDADGTVDYSTSDPVPPAASSGGDVDTITPGPPPDGGSPPGPGNAPRSLSARYTQGSATYMYPKVRVVDDKGALSAWQSVKLGISGWAPTVLNESQVNYKTNVTPNMIGVDPKTNKIVIVGTHTNPEMTGDYDWALYYITQSDSELWPMETVTLPFLEGDIGDSVSPTSIIWDEFKQPIITLNNQRASKFSVWAAQRRPLGNWEITELNVSSLPGQHSSFGGAPSPSNQPGKFAGKAVEYLYDKDSLYGGGYHLKYYVMFYDHGDWRFEYTGYDTAESYDQLNTTLGADEDDLLVYYRVIGDRTGGPWAARWTPGVGFTDPYRIDGGTLSFGAPYTNCLRAVEGADGARITLWEDGNNNADRQFWLLKEGPNNDFSANNLTTIGEHGAFHASYTKGLYVTPAGAYGCFLSMYAGIAEYETNHIQIKDGQPVVEVPLSTYLGAGFGDIINSCSGPNGDVAALYIVTPTETVSDFSNTYFLLERLDPRVAE